MNKTFTANVIKWAGVGMVMMALFAGTILNAQVTSTDRRTIRIGELQNHYTAYGSDRAALLVGSSYIYEGLQWPAGYYYQDNSVIRRQWIGCTNFTSTRGENFEKYMISFYGDNVNTALFPTQLKQTAKFATPTVYVDGVDISAPFAGDVDEIDPTIIPDRIVVNKVNTSMGLTITRTIYAFSQQYHNNYFIQIWNLANTGNTDYDDEIELTNPLTGVRFSCMTRYSVSREGSYSIDAQQSWGKFTWASKRGETYAQHAGEKITEANPIVDWIRCGFEYAGQSPINSFDNIGGPYVTKDGRLASAQHAGLAVLHVDKSAADKNDDVNQPNTLGWHAGDSYTSFGSNLLTDVDKMALMYSQISGIPWKTGFGGNERMDEKYYAPMKDPSTVHNDGGGTGVWICYGPWDLQPGESVTIIEAEGVSGLGRAKCEEIGRRWKKAYLDATDQGPFTLPNGTTTTNKDEYKNAWVFTGKDSIILTFGRAKRNLDAGYLLPQPPQPPPLVDIKSGGDRINVTWSASPSESETGFGGYKVFRATGRTDTTYQEIYSGPAGVYSHSDLTAIRGISYYYYVVAFSDGSNNSSGETNPTGPLMSSRYYTQTTEPAYLRRKAGTNLDQIRVVPNPYNLKSEKLQYTGEPDKIMFLNIPALCTIRIYTERGDLINTIEHTNGSGDESWNSITSSRQVIVSGIYIAHFEVSEDYTDPETGELLYKKGDAAFRKFVIIR